jgi:magnesium transporter
MVAQFTVAASMGTLLPFLLRKARFDPALSSGPFVTMASDLTGLIIYFSLASYMIERLIAPTMAVAATAGVS